jgi:hypothetical protein
MRGDFLGRFQCQENVTAVSPGAVSDEYEKLPETINDKGGRTNRFCCRPRIQVLCLNGGRYKQPMLSLCSILSLTQAPHRICNVASVDAPEMRPGYRTSVVGAPLPVIRHRIFILPEHEPEHVIVVNALGKLHYTAPLQRKTTRICDGSSALLGYGATSMPDIDSVKDRDNIAVRRAEVYGVLYKI